MSSREEDILRGGNNEQFIGLNMQNPCIIYSSRESIMQRMRNTSCTFWLHEGNEVQQSKNSARHEDIWGL